MTIAHDSPAERRVSRWMWFAAGGVLASAAAVAVVLVLTLGGGTGKKTQVLGLVAFEKPLTGATVEFSTGAKATTDRAGNFLLTTHVPRTFTVTTTGGTTAGQLSAVKLQGDYQNFHAARDILTVNVLTTIVSRYRQAHPGVSIAQADARMRKALALPSDLDYHLNNAFVEPWFSSQRFMHAAASSGGFDALVDRVMQGMTQNRFVGRYPAAATNPGGSTAATWVAGKLLEGGGGAVAGAALGALMSYAGLDPTTNAIREINQKLAQLSAQISALQGTTDKVLGELLQEKFQNKLTHLPFTTIETVEGDLLAYTDSNTGADTRAAIKSRIIKNAADFGKVVDAFNDVMAPPAPSTLSVVQHFAKTTIYKKRFWTIGGQRETEQVFDYLDGMQVAAATAYCEFLFLTEPRQTVTVTIGSPAVLTTSNPHDLKAGDKVFFNTTGSLPTGLSPDTPYYVIPAGLTSTSFEVATSPGGAAVNTSGTERGTQTLLPKHAVTLEEARLEARDLRNQRAKQIERNPNPIVHSGSYWHGGVIDIQQKLWIRNSAVNAEHPNGWYGDQVLNLSPPTVAQLHSIVADRGDKTVKQFFIQDLGLQTAMTGVPEFGMNGQLWTADHVYPPSSCRYIPQGQNCTCGKDGEWCLEAASTNNGYIRTQNFCCSATSGPRLYVLQVEPFSANPPAAEKYSYLWS